MLKNGLYMTLETKALDFVYAFEVLIIAHMRAMSLCSSKHISGAIVYIGSHLAKQYKENR